MEFRAQLVVHRVEYFRAVECDNRDTVLVIDRICSYSGIAGFLFLEVNAERDQEFRRHDIEAYRKMKFDQCTGR